MSTPQREPRSRSAFAAAFLSLLFPGLGHAYSGAYARALAFAALPFLSLALLGGVALRSDHAQLLGYLAQPTILTTLLILNAIAFIYRLVAAVDAWQVARFLNAVDASGGGRLGRARLPLNPLSVAGLLAIVLVMGTGHLAVARYNALALDFENCIADPSCGNDATPTTPASAGPSASDEAGALPSATDVVPTPNPSATGTQAPSLEPWTGGRLNVLLIGTDQRPGDSTFNTDTAIVVSIDPKSGQVAMFQVPRDTVGIPVPANAQAVWGRVYADKINSWFTRNGNRTDLWPGANSTARGVAALKAILGNLYGITINYYVMVNFQGFVQSVDTLGGLQINVQIPVADSQFPTTDNSKSRIYIPAGPQHMDGTQALAYARSRKGASNDYDRGYRQQRVILSLRQQMDLSAILANLTSLEATLRSAVKTDVPFSSLPQLLTLAQQIDTKNVRSYVFGPPYFATDMWGPSGGTNSNVVINVARVRQTAASAFSVDPKLLTTRQQLGAEGAQVWVVNGASQAGLASNNADYLSYYGMNASAPNQNAKSTPAHTRIVVYNGAEKAMPATIAYLQTLYGVTVTTATDPGVTTNIVVTLGADAPTLAVPTVG